MGSDGANYGITAGRAIDTILGGKPSPKRDEGMTPAEMRAYLEAVPDEFEWPKDIGSDTSESSEAYNTCARVAGKRVLAFLDAHPEHDTTPTMGEYDWKDRVHYKGFYVVKPGLSEHLKDAKVDLDDLGLSGFQFGWACNAAKYARNAPPSPNPALIEIRVPA